MKRVGPHVHTTGGVFNAPLNAAAVGATAFGLFTKNQRRWDAKPLDNQTIDAFRKNLSDSGFLPKHVLAHNSYLINIGHPDKDLRTRSLNALIDELNRCNLLGLPCSTFIQEATLTCALSMSVLRLLLPRSTLLLIRQKGLPWSWRIPPTGIQRGIYL